MNVCYVLVKNGKHGVQAFCMKVMHGSLVQKLPSEIVSGKKQETTQHALRESFDNLDAAKYYVKNTLCLNEHDVIKVDNISTKMYRDCCTKTLQVVGSEPQGTKGRSKDLVTPTKPTSVNLTEESSGCYLITNQSELEIKGYSKKISFINPQLYKEWIKTAKVRGPFSIFAKFRCECEKNKCLKTWASAKVTLIFPHKITNEGIEYAIQTFGQKCMKCKFLSKPRIRSVDLEEKTKDVITYYLGLRERRFADEDEKFTDPHMSRLCKACELGKCTVSESYF